MNPDWEPGGSSEGEGQPGGPGQVQAESGDAEVLQTAPKKKNTHMP